MRIVLVEDSPADVRLFREALNYSRIDAQIFHLPDGATALAEIEFAAEAWNPRPDLVFLDLNMPCVSGFEVLEALRKTSDYADVPVAVFTSSQSPTDRNRALELHADRYIVKPNTVWDFFDVVTSTVREFDK